MDIIGKLLENHGKWFEIIKSNDYALGIDKNLLDDFLEISRFIEKRGIQNISWLIANAFLKIAELVFFEFWLLTEFAITKIPTIAIFKLKKIIEGNPKFFDFFKNFLNSYRIKYIKQISDRHVLELKTFFVLVETINWYQLVMQKKNSKKSNIKTFKKIISKFNNGPHKEIAGEFLLIAVIIWKQSLEIKYIIECLSENQKNLIKLFCKSIYIDNQGSPISKLFENLLIDKIWSNSSLKHNMYHYTYPKNLYSILKNNSIKFSRMDNLNDKDELKLLECSNNIPYCFSMTEIGDGIDLFGNYTKMNGISVEIDYQVLTRTLLGLTADIEEDDDYLFTPHLFTPFVWNLIKYHNSPKKTVDKETKYLKELFDWLDFDNFLDFSIEKAVESINPFFKKKPWKYENEFRIVINNNFDKAKTLANAEIKNNQLFVNINARKLIKKIIVGPKIKQSDSKMNALKNNLKKLEAEHIKIVKTKADVDLKKWK